LQRGAQMPVGGVQNSNHDADSKQQAAGSKQAKRNAPAPACRCPPRRQPALR
jgi:hypothetical protein